MREVLITDVDGFIVDVELAEDHEEVASIYEQDEEENQILVGYRVAVPVPEGLYKPKFNYEELNWVEGLTQEEIDEIKATPIPKSADDKIAELEAVHAERIEQLEKENTDALLAITELYEMILSS